MGGLSFFFFWGGVKFWFCFFLGGEGGVQFLVGVEVVFFFRGSICLMFFGDDFFLGGRGA